MPYDRNIFALQYSLVDDFVKHLILHRLLKSLIKGAQLSSAFWGLTADAHLMQASIYWCMVFGSTGMNHTHWKRLEHEEKQDIEEQFRNGLVAELNINFEEWSAYWDEMLYFRNNYAAHRVGEYDRLVPSFDYALEAAYFYDSWAREVIKPDVVAEPPLRNVAADFERALAPMLEHIIESGRGYEQTP